MSMGQTHVTSGSTPLGELVLQERQRRGLKRRELAGLVRRADRTLRTNEKAIERWELRGHVPQQPALRALAAVLEKPVEQLVALAHRPSVEPIRAALAIPPAAPADHEYVEAIHATIRNLVGLEVQHGGDEVAPLALRSFREARRRLALGSC
jgi:transcriptional regulator with XRE-family HTH domain